MQEKRLTTNSVRSETWMRRHKHLMWYQMGQWMSVSKTVTVKTPGHDKTHVTAVLSCCADGTRLPLLLISEMKTLPKDRIPLEIFVHIHPKG